MSILDVDEARNCFDHLCDAPGCRYITRGLRLDPAAGDLSVWREQGGNGPHASGDVVAIVVRRCPLCGSQDTLNPDLPPWEALEIDPTTGAPIRQPGSLVGASFADTRAVVVEHAHGYLAESSHVAAVRLIRRMQRHPHLAPHAPLIELRPTRYNQLCAVWLAAAKASAQADPADPAAGSIITPPGAVGAVSTPPGEPPTAPTAPAAPAAPAAPPATPATPASPPATGTGTAAPGAAEPPSSPAS